MNSDELRWTSIQARKILMLKDLNIECNQNFNKIVSLEMMGREIRKKM